MGFFGNLFGKGEKANEMGGKEAPKTVKDSVCGMKVNPMTAPARSEYQGKTYYFCNPGCKQAFDKEPAKYIGAPASHGGHNMISGG